MDIKTLEYMGERVDKARKIKNHINSINNRIEWLKKEDINITSISIKDKRGNTIGLGEYVNETEVPTVVQLIKESVLTILEEYCNSLQKELDEL